MKIFFISLFTILCSLPSVYASTSDIEAAIMNKNYEEAGKIAVELLKTTLPSTERIQIEYYLGLSQLRLNEPAQARNAFQIVMSAAETEDLYDRAALGMMEALYAQGFYKEALNQGHDLLRKSPKSAVLSLIYLKLARTNLKLMQWNAAREYLKKILKEFPESVEAPVAKNLLEEKEFFAVQVGSFKGRDKAQNLMERLKATGQYAYIVETSGLDGSKFYRVRVGRMASLSDAQNLEAQLTQLGYPTLIYP